MNNKENTSRYGKPVRTKIVSREMGEKALRIAGKNKLVVKVIGSEGEEYIQPISMFGGISESISIVPKGKVRIQVEDGYPGYFLDVLLRRGRNDAELSADIANWHQVTEEARAKTKSYANEVRKLRAELARENSLVNVVGRLMFGTTSRKRIAKLKYDLWAAQSCYEVELDYRKRRVRDEKVEHYSGVYLPKVAHEDN